MSVQDVMCFFIILKMSSLLYHSFTTVCFTLLSWTVAQDHIAQQVSGLGKYLKTSNGTNDSVERAEYSH